jgi:hypothetical protein
MINIIGPQGTSMCSQGPHVHRIPYKSGHFFTTFCKKIPRICNKIQEFFTIYYEFFKCRKTSN